MISGGLVTGETGTETKTGEAGTGTKTGEAGTGTETSADEGKFCLPIYHTTTRKLNKFCRANDH